MLRIKKQNYLSHSKINISQHCIEEPENIFNKFGESNREYIFAMSVVCNFSSYLF